ncbi:MAG: M14 family metallopeptidase [Terriglobia bacterium]
MFERPWFTVLFSLLLLVFSPSLHPLRAQSEFDSKVPTPKSVIGHEVGEQFTHFFQLEQYYKAVAAASDRVKLVKYGETYEARPLYMLVISTPENLKRLDTIQKNVLSLSDPRKTNPTAAEVIIQKSPAVCWLSYNVHGNESSSAEAALAVIYRLSAANDSDTRFILENTVAIVDPLVNPDGHERYVNFYEQQVGRQPNADPNASEHSENWPGGRFNHYLFDLNRDWAWQTQRETQDRIRVYRQWNPQVHVDYHEMGAESTYYFPPNALPINANISSQVVKWLKIFGEENAKAFDIQGWQYFTHEDFDLFYPAYGDSWPAFNGAVGMTYEQAGGGMGGLRFKRRDESFLTLKDRMDHHITSSMTTLLTTARNREALLRDYYKDKQESLDEGQRGPVKAYLIPAGRDPQRSASLINLLLSQGIEVMRATEGFTAPGIHDYFGATFPERHFPEGTFVVRVAQPLGRLVRALLEPEAVLKEKFFYDITAWSMPLAFGIEAYYTDSSVSVPAEAVQQVSYEAGGVDGKAKAAYVFEWKTNSAARLLARLLRDDIKASVSLKPFTIQGRSFEAGSIVIPIGRNKDPLHDRLAAAAKEFHVAVYAENTMLSQLGVDLGSNYVREIRKPKIAVVTGQPVSPSEYGAIWNMFDNQYGIEFTPLKVDQLRGADLRDYNVLILPDDSGTGRGYSRSIDRGTTDRLKAWVRDGGTLIGLKGGAVFATEKRSGLSSVTYRYVLKRDEDARIEEEKAAQPSPPGSPARVPEPPSSPLPQDEKNRKENEARELADKLKTWDQKEEKSQTDRIPGALMKIQLDNTHPLAFGYGKEVVVANLTSPILALTSKGDNVGYYPKENFRVSGFITDENLKKFPNTAYLIREDVGRGHVILYGDDPNFRSFWEGTSRLFLNSIFFGAIENPDIR